MGIIRINYDEFDKDSYESVEIKCGDQNKVFNTGNFVKDWFDMQKFIASEELNETYWSYSSSVDHFITDGAPYDYGYLHCQNDGYILKYLDRTDPKWYETQSDISEGIEFFVPENTQPTWNELKEMCSDDHVKMLKDFQNNLINNSKPLEDKYQAIVNKYFMDLL